MTPDWRHARIAAVCTLAPFTIWLGGTAVTFHHPAKVEEASDVAIVVHGSHDYTFGVATAPHSSLLT
jgi:hypothetical protein